MLQAIPALQPKEETGIGHTTLYQNAAETPNAISELRRVKTVCRQIG